MKRITNNPKLWQNKRGELPVNGNPDMDWLQMLSALDQHMPVTSPVKKHYRLKTSKWWLNGLIAISSVIVIYAVVQFYFSNRHHPAQHQHIITRDSIIKDPVLKKNIDTALTGPSHTQPVKSADGHPVTGAIEIKKDSTASHQRVVTDTNSIPHRDSLLSPVNINPLKTVHDSVKAPVIDDKTIRKDTAGTGKKGLKKRKRQKLGIFT